jgi:hypothetical protein
MWAGYVVNGAVYEFLFYYDVPDPEGIAVIVQGGPIFALAFAVPYSLLLFFLGRKNADSVLVPLRLFLSSAVIMGITWMWLDAVYLKGPDWTIMVAVTGPILYAVIYVYLMGKWKSKLEK